jgi:hypothetical protein
LICAFAAIAGSSPARAAAQGPVRGAELTSRAATIVGNVVDADDKPIAAARLRLRNVADGRIVASARGDQNGQFRFAGVASGTYLVEVLDERGNVRGVSQAFTVGPGEILSTIVRLTVHRPWYSGFFSNAAIAAVSSAAALGVTAVGNGGQPASGRF